jgi:MFS family permease
MQSAWSRSVRSYLKKVNRSYRKQGTAISAIALTEQRRTDEAASAEIIQPVDAAVQPSAGFSTVLRNPAFLKLWLAQAISQTGLNMANYGLIILVAKESGSLISTALTIVAFTLPALLFSAPAGIVVDRFDRHGILWISNLLRAFVALLFVITLLINPTNLLPLYLLAFLMTSVGAFFAPAEGAAIPSLVEQQDLLPALSLFNITFSLAQAVGLVVFGPVLLHWLPTFSLSIAGQSIVFLPVESLFLVVGVLYLICTLLVLFIPALLLKAQQTSQEVAIVAQETGTRAINNTWKSLIETWNYIRDDAMLGASIGQLTLGGVITAVLALISPTFMVQFLKLPEELAGLMFVPGGIGLVLGSVIMPRLMRRFRYISVVVTGSIVLAMSPALVAGVYQLAPLVLSGQWWHSWPYLTTILIVMFCMGLSINFVTLPAQAQMQERSSYNVKGRVLAFQMLLLNGFTIPSVLAIGQIADEFGLIAAMNVLAGAIAITSLGSIYYGRAGRRRVKNMASGS